MTTILQISDTHIASGGRLVSGRLDTAASLETLVTRIVACRPRFGPVDAVLVSGDISDDGSAESYGLFKSLMAPLDLPMLVIPGNHDLRAPLRAAFAFSQKLPQSGKLNWRSRVGEIDIIGLDTLVEGEGGGVLDEATLTFLDDALKEARKRPVLLAMHHPPFSSGIAFMDRIGLSGTDALAHILRGHDAELRVVCGHIHSTMIASVGGKTALSAPAPGSCFAYDVSPDAPVGFMHQDDGFMLHHWSNGFRSLRIPLDPGPGPYPF